MGTFPGAIPRIVPNLAGGPLGLVVMARSIWIAAAFTSGQMQSIRAAGCGVGSPAAGLASCRMSAGALAANFYNVLPPVKMIEKAGTGRVTRQTF